MLTILPCVICTGLEHSSTTVNICSQTKSFYQRTVIFREQHPKGHSYTKKKPQGARAPRKDAIVVLRTVNFYFARFRSESSNISLVIVDCVCKATLPSLCRAAKPTEKINISLLTIPLIKNIYLVTGPL